MNARSKHRSNQINIQSPPSPASRTHQPHQCPDRNSTCLNSRPTWCPSDLLKTSRALTHERAIKASVKSNKYSISTIPSIENTSAASMPRSEQHMSELQAYMVPVRSVKNIQGLNT